MANVKKYTDQIAKAQKGRDVRDAIVNAINAVSDENNEYNQVKTDILEAQTDITEKVAKNEHTEQKFVADVKKAETLKQGLDSNIEQGTALKSQLETTISTADTGKKNLDASNTTAAETKADLDASNATASETKTGLDATNKTAAGLVTSLGDKIAEGTQVKTDIQTTGETAMSNLQAEAAKQQEYIKTSIDDTLSVSGKAADAAVTGKKIDSLKEDLDTQSSNLDYEVNSRLKQFYKYSKGATKINDSDNGRLHNLKVYGRSEQKQYSGKNLLNATLQTTTVNGVTCTNNGDGTYTLDGTANANAVFNLGSVTFTGDTKYKICGCPQGGGIIERYHIEPYGSTNEQRDIGNGVIYSLSNDETKAIYIVVTIGFRASNLLFKPMITTDLTATYDNFEPYTGGIPSPNPDYPQEIKSVVNPTVKVCGKNLFKATLGNTTANGVTCTNNGDGTYTLNGTCTANTPLSKIGIFDHILNEPLCLTGVPSGCGSYLALARYDGNNILVTDGKNTKIDAGIHTKHIEFWITKGTTLNNVIFKPMLTTDLTATYDDFELYHEQTVTLPYTLNAIPVNSGGNVTIDGQQYIADYVDVERGKRIKYITKKYIKDLPFVYSSTDKQFFINLTNIKLLNIDIMNNIISSCFSSGNNKESFKSISNGEFYIKQNVFNIKCDKFTNVDDLKSALGNEYFLYDTTKPEETDLTEEELQSFKLLQAYYPTTNISINSEQLDGYTVFNYPIPFEDEWIKTKKDVDSLKEDISTKITKFYASSQGENHLADSDNGKIQDMMLYGKSEQKRYSGKNLLNATLQTTTQNGVTCTANGDGTYTINGTATSDTLFHIGYFIFEKDTKYKIVGCPQGGSLNTLYRLDGSLNANSDTGNGIVYSGDGNKRNARIVVFNGATVNNLLFKPMITTDLTATYDDFEPYTGGIPSPNPDYPQEIKSVANPTVKVCGKNLLNSNNISTGIINPSGIIEENNEYFYTDFIRVKDEITISYNITSDYIRIAKYNSDKTFLTRPLLPPSQKYITINDCEFIKLSAKKDVINQIQIELGSTSTAYEPYHEQTVTLPYTLNAIPVESGGNVTIDGQQYIADYVDVERGKLVRMVYVLDASANADMFRNYWEGETDGKQYLIRTDFASPPFSIEENAQTWCNKYNLLSNNFEYTRFDGCLGKKSCVYIGNPRSIQIYLSLYNQKLSTIKEQREWLKNNQTYIYVPLNTPEEADLTTEEIAAFKALATYYPITNISINSEQLDGYAVFNYPISMENGWNYVKQQIGDTREYIYDMDARAQDTDLQAAEAYVNSEYAVALTELEV